MAKYHPAMQQRVAEQEIPAPALTDDGPVYGVIPSYAAAANDQIVLANA